jgi:hypothetical protein
MHIYVMCVCASERYANQPRALQPDPLRHYAPLIRGRSAIRLFVFQPTNVYVVYSQLDPAGVGLIPASYQFEL